MTLKQAIHHAKEVGNIELCQNDHEMKCAGEHRQLARWLEELMMYRQLDPFYSSRKRKPYSATSDLYGPPDTLK